MAQTLIQINIELVTKHKSSVLHWPSKASDLNPSKIMLNHGVRRDKGGPHAQTLSGGVFSDLFRHYMMMCNAVIPTGAFTKY